MLERVRKDGNMEVHTRGLGYDGCLSETEGQKIIQKCLRYRLTHLVLFILNVGIVSSPVACGENNYMKDSRCLRM